MPMLRGVRGVAFSTQLKQNCCFLSCRFTVVRRIALSDFLGICFSFRCLVDGVKGREIFSMFYTIPLLVILIMNAVLYLLSWLKISSEVRQIRANLGQDPPSRMTARRAATSMSMLVAAFLIQWWPTGLWGAWELFGKAHETLMHFCVTFANLGGVLNLGVYLIINRKRLSINKNNVGSVRGPKY